MKNKTTAALLALFLGGFGVHKFYLDRPVLGLTYLLFCWTFIPVLIAFGEAIFLFMYTDEDFNNVYNKGIVVSSSSVADELEKLHGLKERGVITQEEFDNKKAGLI